MERSDAELIERWQRGDSLAFEALVRRWQQPIGRILFRLVNRAHLVPDLCQDVFLRVYQAGPRYREAGTFAGWLHRIALNVARDAVRRFRTVPVSLNGQELPASSLACEKALENREQAQQVVQALAELPEPLREVLVLRHYEDMNFEQIARLTSTPASTLKSRFAVALNRLKKRLIELGCES